MSEQLKIEETVYYIIAHRLRFGIKRALCSYWSLGPSEQDAWRFFGNGCVDGEKGIERIKAEGAICIPVRLITPERLAELETKETQHGVYESAIQHKMDELREEVKNLPETGRKLQAERDHIKKVTEDRATLRRFIEGQILSFHKWFRHGDAPCLECQECAEQQHTIPLLEILRETEHKTGNNEG
jgi:hypothetical protein